MKKCEGREEHAEAWRVKARTGKSTVVCCTLCGAEWRTRAGYVQYLPELGRGVR